MGWDEYRLTCMHGKREELDWHDCDKCKEVCRKLGHEHSEHGLKSQQGWHIWTRSYIIKEVGGRKSITCLSCFMESHSQDDVRHKYCGKCNVFHK